MPRVVIGDGHLGIWGALRNVLVVSPVALDSPPISPGVSRSNCVHPLMQHTWDTAAIILLPQAVNCHLGDSGLIGLTAQNARV